MSEILGELALLAQAFGFLTDRLLLALPGKPHPSLPDEFDDLAQFSCGPNQLP